MSSITLISEDSTFIKMKPAILYICLAIFLLADLFFIKKLFVRKVYQKIFHEKGIMLSEKNLRKITTHWIILLLVVAFIDFFKNFAVL